MKLLNQAGHETARPAISHGDGLDLVAAGHLGCGRRHDRRRTMTTLTVLPWL